MLLKFPTDHFCRHLTLQGSYIHEQICAAQTFVARERCLRIPCGTKKLLQGASCSITSASLHTRDQPICALSLVVEQQRLNSSHSWSRRSFCKPVETIKVCLSHEHLVANANIQTISAYFQGSCELSVLGRCRFGERVFESDLVIDSVGIFTPA